MPTPVTDDERARITQLLEAGWSYARIATDLGRGIGTISRHANSIGWKAEQSAALRTQHAREARSAFCAERRAELAARATERAAELLEGWDQPYRVFNFGGKENDYNEHTLEAPPVEAKRQMVAAFRDLMRTVLDVDRHDNRAEEGMAAVDAWLRDVVGEAVPA